MKLVIVTQWVILKEFRKVPPGQSLASRSVAESAGKTGDGSLEPEEARIQALY